MISVSQGHSRDESYENPAVRAAMANADILFVCSADNQGTPRLNFPSAFDLPNVLSVANVTNEGELSDTSSYGPELPNAFTEQYTMRGLRSATWA